MSDKQVKTNYGSVKWKRIILGCLGVMLFILLIAYLCISQYYKDHFYAKTFINGMDCSNLTAEEAKQVITTGIDGYVLTIEARDGSTQQIGGQDIGLKCTFDQEIADVLDSQSAYSWISNALKENKVDNPYKLTFNEDKLSTVVKNLNCLAKDKQVAPTNASISKYDKTNGFTVVKEEQGNKLDKDKVKKAVTDAINNLSSKVSLEEADCYKKPSITSEDQLVTTAMQTINKYMQTKLTYKFGDKTEVFDGTNIGPAITVDKKFNVSINQAKIKEYITYLDETYSTKGGPWTFVNGYGQETTVKGGSYGWSLNESEELKAVMACIKEGNVQEMEPTSSIKGMKYGQSTLGNTYVEVNLTKQHMFFFKDGKKVLESNVVTGKPVNGHATPAGVYSVNLKQRNKTLRGKNDDGSSYASKVAYWMPFNGGIGLHDASWQSGHFVQSRYLTGGSHGCVNLPVSVAKQLYEALPVHTPVIVYK